MHQALQAAGCTAVIYGVAHTQTHAGDHALICLAVQVNNLSAGCILSRRPAGSGKHIRQGPAQLFGLRLRQRLRAGGGDCQLLPGRQGQDVTGPGRDHLPGLLNKSIRQCRAAGCVFVLSQGLAGLLRHLADNLGADLLVHNGPQLPLPLRSALAQHIGCRLAVAGGTDSIFLHLPLRILQQLFFLLPGQRIVPVDLIFQSGGTFLRLFRLVQLSGDLFLALSEHPGDHLAGDKKQSSKQNQKVCDCKQNIF